MGGFQLESQVRAGKASPPFEGVCHKFWLLDYPWVDTIPAKYLGAHTSTHWRVHLKTLMSSIPYTQHRMTPSLANSLALRCSNQARQKQRPYRHSARDAAWACLSPSQKPGMQRKTHAEVWDADEGARAGFGEAVALHHWCAHGYLQKLLHMPCSTHAAFRYHQLHSSCAVPLSATQRHMTPCTSVR